MKKLFKRSRFRRRRRFEPRALLDFSKAIAARIWEWIVTAWEWIVRVYRYLTGELRRRALMAKLEKADIILASPRTLRLSPIALIYRLALRAQYVHSMLYIGFGQIIHTTSRHGVVIGRLPRKVYRKDSYTILRMPDLRPEQRDRVVTEALKFKDRKLDRTGLVTNVPARLIGLRKPLLRLEKNRLWCSKLIYHAYSAAGVDLVPQENIETITSEDLSRSPLLQEL